MAKSKIKTVLIDDHQILIDAYKDWLAMDDRFQVLQSFDNGLEAKAYIENMDVDLVLCDQELPKMNGTELCRMVKGAKPELKFIIVSAHSDEVTQNNVIHSKADGFVPKRFGAKQLILAIDEVMAGRKLRYSFPQTEAESSSMGGKRKLTEYEQFTQRLTKREREIVRLVAEGKTNPEIADLISRDLETVKSHRRNIKSKTGLVGVRDYIHFVLKAGIYPFPEEFE